ncbi:family 16 glycosylhydrolase [Homoserinimonas sp. A520]
MNKRSIADFRQSLLHHGRLRLRVLDWRRRATVFSRGPESDALRRVYVINLDRRPDRWRRVRRELDRFRDRHGERLSGIARRFSAIDARYIDARPNPAELIPRYTLADQLTVDPNPLLQIDDETRALEIKMTKQEVAVAQSHIEVWKLIANGDVPSALVLEDDVFMTHGFARDLEATWLSLIRPGNDAPNFDLLYLAFGDVGGVSPVRNGTGARRLKKPGIWEASGYVLTREGARALLDQLPAYGPIDLWLNMQFGRLQAFTAARPLIEQRIDEPSTNSYSVLPVLSQVGVITREKPLVPATKHLPGPVIAVGEPGTGLTALATALSMLGFTCTSDVEHLPAAEERALLHGSRGRLFNAYVNIGSLSAEALRRLARTNPNAHFISTSPHQALTPALNDRTLMLPPDIRDKWGALTEFLAIDYPALPYPIEHDTGQRNFGQTTLLANARHSTDLRHDAGPWIVKPTRAWRGIPIDADPLPHTLTTSVDWASGETLDRADWELRDDTFPSNMALFTPANVTQTGSHALLTLRHEKTSVRELTSGAIATTASYRYGTFKAKLRPPGVSGLVTGMFLHRNGPRQEIDIEFLGKDTSKMLVNVFYNPGPNSTKLEYGYRGTPTLIDLGFDAADSFHTYEIDWQPNMIRWLVDGEVVYQRNTWEPTPIPNQPLQFNVNLWHSRSREFTGDLASTLLPVSASIRSVEIYGSAQTASDEVEGSLDEASVDHP